MERLVCLGFFSVEVENIYKLCFLSFTYRKLLYMSLTGVLVSYRKRHKHKMSFFLLSRKEMIAQQREYKKKKALKKAQRIKELEQEREDQKVKWQQFNNRAYSKNKKGQVGLVLSVCE